MKARHGAIIITGLLVAAGTYLYSQNQAAEVANTEASNTLPDGVFFRDELRGFEILSNPLIEASGYSVKVSTSTFNDDSYFYKTYLPSAEGPIYDFNIGLIEVVPKQQYEKINCDGIPLCMEPDEIGSNSEYVITHRPSPPSDALLYCEGRQRPSFITEQEIIEFTKNNSAFCRYFTELKVLEQDLTIFNVFDPVEK